MILGRLTPQRRLLRTVISLSFYFVKVCQKNVMEVMVIFILFCVFLLLSTTPHTEMSSVFWKTVLQFSTLPSISFPTAS